MTFLKKLKKKNSKTPFKYSVGGIASSYKSPFEYTIETFKKEGQEDINVPVLDGVPQFKVPEGFTKKTEEAAVNTQTTGAGEPITAKEILKDEKIPSAEDVLKSERVSSASELLSRANVPSATEILKAEKEKEERQAKLFEGERLAKQAFSGIEQGLLKKEEEYLNSLDWKNFSTLNSEATYDTKFGSFKASEISYAGNTYGASVGGNKYASDLFLPGSESTYRFVPEEILFKGLRVGDNLYLNGAFLQKDHWDKFLEKSQYIELAKDKINPAFQDYSGRGFLFSKEDFNTFFPKNSWGVLNYKTSEGFAGYHGDVVGLLFDESKNKLIYVTQPAGKSQVSYIQPSENSTNPYQLTAKGEWLEQKDTPFGSLIRSIPIIGDPLVNLATDIAKAFAQVPFGPEIAYALSGGNPYVYAAFTSLKIAGQGSPLEDRVLGAAKAFATASLSSKLSDYSKGMTDQLAKAGLNPTMASAAGNAITYAGFNGAMAAMTGGDIKEAMTSGAVSGAIGGAISVNAKQITSTILGGDTNVVDISKTLGISTGQLEGVIAGSLHRASFAATKGEDFSTVFKNSLIESGFSTVVTNQVASSLDKTLTKESRDAIIKNTQLITSTIAKAAVRGQDLEMAIKKIEPQLITNTSKAFTA